MGTGFGRFRLAALAFSVLCVSFAVGHAFCPRFAGDNIILYFLALALLPWIGDMVQVLKLPGGYEVEFKAAQSAKKLEDALGPAAVSLPYKTMSLQPEVPSEEAGPVDALVRSPEAGLSRLGLQLKRQIRALADKELPGSAGAPLPKIIRDLGVRGALNRQEARALADFVRLLDSVPGFPALTPLSTHRLLHVGESALKDLEARIGEPK